MTNKEISEIALDLAAFFDVCGSDESDAAESANAAITMCTEILRRYPKLRFELWERGCSEIMDNLGLDYGQPY